MTGIKKSKRAQVFAKFNGHCAYCGETLHTFQVDHIVPKKNFAQHIHNRIKVPAFLQHLTETDVNHIDNLFPSCYSCNSYKDSMDVETFRNELNLLIERLNKYSTQYRIVKRYGMVNETNKKLIFHFEKPKYPTCAHNRYYYDCPIWHAFTTGCMNCKSFIEDKTSDGTKS